MRRSLRSLGTGAVAGLVVGLVVGGTLGRAHMRLLTLADDESLGLRTAMGAIVGAFTLDGTRAVYGFGAFAGVLLGLAYAVGRPLAPAGLRARTALFVTAATAFLTGLIVRENEEDFGFLPPLLSLGLTAATVALTALPVPWLVERLAPRPVPVRLSPRARAVVVGVPLTAMLAFGISGVVIALTTPSPFGA